MANTSILQPNVFAKGTMVKIFKSIKKMLPKTLFGRSLIIVIAPVVLIQSITTYVFFDRHWSKVTQLLAENIAGKISSCLAIVDQKTTNTDIQIVEKFAAKHFDMVMSYTVDDILKLLPPNPGYSWREMILQPVLQQQLNSPFKVYINDQQIFVQTHYDDGYFNFIIPTKQLFTRTTSIFIWWCVLTPALFLFIAIVFLKNQVKPLKELSEIVDEFGKGRDVKSLKPHGALEVKKVARAFNSMKERIHRQMTQRSEMLAGVSHDLKTPLTRMELCLAMMPQHLSVTDMQEDVREMAQMIEDYLAFARGEEGERSQYIDLSELIFKIQHKMDRDHIHFSTMLDAVYATVRPNNIQRCFTNVISNALRYANNAYITVQQLARQIHVIVEDDGPGIVEDEYDNVLRPFYRLEASRNKETGGSGLGLTITQTIMHDHGGEIKLGRSLKYKGLKVTLIIPK